MLLHWNYARKYVWFGTRKCNALADDYANKYPYTITFENSDYDSHAYCFSNGVDADPYSDQHIDWYIDQHIDWYADGDFYTNRFANGYIYSDCHAFKHSHSHKFPSCPKRYSHSN